MIIDSILFVLSNVLRIFLLPLEVVNIAVDFASSIPFVTQFFQIVAYIIPWTNFVPLFTLVVALLSLKIVISFIKTLWAILPFL